MVARLNVGDINFTFVFRHRWDERDKSLGYNVEFRDYSIGLWFRHHKIVGRKNFNNPEEWKNNLVNEYMIGIDLIICKAWMSFSKSGMKSLEIKL